MSSEKFERESPSRQASRRAVASQSLRQLPSVVQAALRDDRLVLGRTGSFQNVEVHAGDQSRNLGRGSPPRSGLSATLEAAARLRLADPLKTARAPEDSACTVTTGCLHGMRQACQHLTTLARAYESADLGSSTELISSRKPIADWQPDVTHWNRLQAKTLAQLVMQSSAAIHGIPAWSVLSRSHRKALR